jgi:hypothetical protein
VYLFHQANRERKETERLQAINVLKQLLAELKKNTHAKEELLEQLEDISGFGILNEQADDLLEKSITLVQERRILEAQDAIQSLLNEVEDISEIEKEPILVSLAMSYSKI